jgi:hypothetical protein
MDLQEYFETARGIGILSTADSSGNVDSAIYARPHFIDFETIAFIMADRRSHRNLQSNPKGVYLFIEDDAGYHGNRVYIEKCGEERNSPLIEDLRRNKRAESDEETGKDRFLVYFKIIGIRPLTGETQKR